MPMQIVETTNVSVKYVETADWEFLTKLATEFQITMGYLIHMVAEDLRRRRKDPAVERILKRVDRVRLVEEALYPETKGKGAKSKSR